MERRFLEAAQKGNIEELNDLIRSNGLILKEMALEGVGHTPLHVACVAGHLDFVRELLKLMPKFVEKVNAAGLGPLHIAAAQGDVEIARELLRVGQHLCSVKGRERRIPLHYAIINGEVDVMKVLLSASPESVEETTAREETVLHLAVKNNRFEAVIVLVEHLKQHKKEQVINWQDNEGNTVLHIAAAVQNFEVVNFMLCGFALEVGIVEVNVLIKSGSTPLDVSCSDREIREILTRAGAKHQRSNLPSSRVAQEDGNEGDIKGATSCQSGTNKKEESPGDIRNALLVVAALIASATYQSVLQPPRFSSNVDPNSIKGFLAPPTFVSSHAVDVIYTIFMTGNTFGFFVSIQMIVCLTRNLPFRLPLTLSLAAMIQTYVCFIPFMPFTSMNKELPLITALVLSVLPLITSLLLLLIQKWLARAIEFSLKGLFRQNLTSDMYSLIDPTPRR